MDDDFIVDKIKPKSEPTSQMEAKADTKDAGDDIEIKEIKPDASSPKKHKFSKKKLYIFGGLGIFLLLLLIATVIPGIFIYKNGKAVAGRVQSLEKAATEDQDLEKIRSEMSLLKTDLAKLGKSVNYLYWVKPIPIAGKYWSDAHSGVKAGIYGIEAAEIGIDAIEPYADIIGLKAGGHEAASPEETANDRISFIVQTAHELAPESQKVAEKLDLARIELNKIDPERYPEEFRGIVVREKLRDGIDTVDQAAELLKSSKGLFEQAQYILGVDGEREYLVIFQNDKELRPTGGFITAYSIMTVKDGKVSPVISSDIYSLDDNYTPSVPAPEPIVDYLKGPYTISPNYRLRDMNFSPDFRSSMELFLEEAKKAGVENVDGVIAVDTHVLVSILDVIGEIGVPGFGNFSNNIVEECDCPQVIYELESFADNEGPIVWSENEPGKIVFAPKNYDNRKKIVGPLMNSILGNALGQPKEKMPDLFKAGLDSVLEKHILMYLYNDDAQKAIEDFGIGGRIKDYEGDYLHINDSNLGGRKSNLYVTQEVDQQLDFKDDGTIEKTLKITYKNPKDYDGWLNSVLPNWTRIYVPKGSELVSADGFTDKGETYEEFGKTVFSGGFELRPQGVVQLTIVYKLPFKAQNYYNLLVQKQPGVDAPLYSISGGNYSNELFLTKDKEFSFKI